MSNLDKGLPDSMYDNFDNIRDMTDLELRRERASDLSYELSCTLESKGYEMKFMPDWVGYGIMNAHPSNADERVLFIEKVMSDLGLSGEITHTSETMTHGLVKVDDFEVLIYVSEDEPANINAQPLR